MASAEDIMQTDMLTAQASEKVSSVAYNMAINNVGATLVVENKKLVGIFSERDLLRRVIAEQRDLDETTVEEVSTPMPRVVKKDTPFKECLDILKEANFRHLPVVNDEHEPLGIISSRDFFRQVTRALETMISEKEHQEKIASGQIPYEKLADDLIQ